ncbi:MAG: c-type cytochrome [Nitrospiraceae bacterium]
MTREIRMMHRHRIAAIAVIAVLSVATNCAPPRPIAGSHETAGGLEQDRVIDALFAPPSPETIPGDLRGEQIRLGYKMVVDTQEYGKRYVGNALNCTNCHLDAGLNPNAASYVGISVLYPEYRARAGRPMSLADRINECFERSMNGKALPPDSSKLAALVAYIDWLSQNVPRGSTVPWRGIPRITSTRAPDPVNGKDVFTKKCAFCHGSDGQGTMAAPPLWGPRSYNIGAGMARVGVAASFIKANMPRGWGWSVTDDEAFDVAAYVNSQPRPDFPGKVHDWPNGGKPADVPY